MKTLIDMKKVFHRIKIRSKSEKSEEDKKHEVF